MTEIPLISIVDDDDDARAATESLVKSLGFATRTFASAESFLQSSLVSETWCLMLDVQMPTLGGLELQEHLFHNGFDIPLIFITAYADQTARARALSAGAICFLLKPLDEQRLIECLNEALKRRGRPAPDDI